MKARHTGPDNMVQTANLDHFIQFLKIWELLEKQSFETATTVAPHLGYWGKETKMKVFLFVAWDIDSGSCRVLEATINPAVRESWEKKIRLAVVVERLYRSTMSKKLRAFAEKNISSHPEMYHIEEYDLM